MINPHTLQFSCSVIIISAAPYGSCQIYFTQETAEWRSTIRCRTNKSQVAVVAFPHWHTLQYRCIALLHTDALDLPSACSRELRSPAEAADFSETLALTRGSFP